MIKIHLLAERDRFGNPHGSGHIRLLRPFSHPALAGCFQVSVEDTLPQTGADVVLVERGWRADATLEAAETFVAGIRALGAKLIYTIDDNLLDLHDCQPWHEFSTATKRNIVRYFLRQADSVIVSTEALKQRLLRLNPSIDVVPNALDERLFLPDAETILKPETNNLKREGLLTIGYMGTYSHLQDLMMVMEPLRAAMRAHAGKVAFQLVGISTDNRVAQCFESLPFKILDTGGGHFYPDFVPWARENLHWDLAIAPLEDNMFTRGKSDIKFLDYSLLGIPAIYSNVEAYRHSVEHGKTGWLCDNHPNAWKTALTAMIEQPALRQDMSRAAFDYATRERLLRHCAINWKDAIMRTVALNRVH